MDPSEPYETLDPENWDEMRALAHRMVDDALTYLQTVRERPVWQPVPEEVAAHFEEKAPHDPGSAEAAYQEFVENILPYPMGTIHPRFWAGIWAAEPSLGALADFLASIMNSNMGGGNHAANLVEEQVINWIKEMIGFPKGCQRTTGQRRLDGQLRRSGGCTKCKGRLQRPRDRDAGRSSTTDRLCIHGGA